MVLEQIREQIAIAARELLQVANLRPAQILVLGCSTSEVLGKRIGSAGNVEVATVILQEMMSLACEHGIYLAVQCCEHLNRALVVEQDAVERYHLETVTVYPTPRAGGATAGTAMAKFHRPAIVESIRAHAGMDIGDTLIGMHLRPVAVPVRLSIKKIGHANLVAARTRPKLIGGQRAIYALDQMEQKSTKSVESIKCDKE